LVEHSIPNLVLELLYIFLKLRYRR